MKRAGHWQQVDPGTEIQVGQPFRVEYDATYAEEDVHEDRPRTIPPTTRGVWFVDSSWRPLRELPTEACVIRAKVTSWDHPRILFGHPNPGEERGMSFCRAVDGLPYQRDEIESFEVLWMDEAEL
jgi:hypothetical protein